MEKRERDVERERKNKEQRNTDITSVVCIEIESLRKIEDDITLAILTLHYCHNVVCQILPKF